MKMPSMILLTVPMQRDGSGTSWLPDNSSLHALHSELGTWNAMLHGQFTLRYTAQDVFRNGSRGASRLSGPSSGSSEGNLIAARVARKWSIRST